MISDDRMRMRQVRYLTAAMFRIWKQSLLMHLSKWDIIWNASWQRKEKPLAVDDIHVQLKCYVVQMQSSLGIYFKINYQLLYDYIKYKLISLKGKKKNIYIHNFSFL